MSTSNDGVDKEQILFHLNAITSNANALEQKYIGTAKGGKRIHDEVAEIRKLIGTTMVQDIEALGPVEGQVG